MLVQIVRDPNALKGQRVIAQGNALGQRSVQAKNAEREAPPSLPNRRNHSSGSPSGFALLCVFA